METNPEFHRKLVEYIQWIVDIGADNVIISIPLLIQLVHEQFPKLKIRVSTVSHVNSVNRAKFYAMMGVNEMTPDVMINRDFKTLEKMQKALKKYSCDLVLLLTDGCLFQCPHRHYHYNTLGHASQTFQQFERNYIDTCIINCSIIKFSNREEAIKTRWIRPEDLSHYEAIGIDKFKIAGRRMSTEWILRAVKAFSDRKYKGNLIDIIQGFTMSFGDLTAQDPGFKGRAFGAENKAKLVIDNTKLDGFIEFFKKQNCIAMCDDCNYCADWADKAVFRDADQAESYVESLQDYLHDIITSREFGLKPKESKDPEKKKGMKWNPQTQKIFNELILLSPPQFQQIARMAISSLAEGKAKAREAEEIEDQDMIPAFLEGTPGPFQAEMRDSLKKYGFKIAD